MPSGFWRVRSFRLRLEAVCFPRRDAGWISPPGVMSRRSARYRSSRLFPPPPGSVTFRDNQFPLIFWMERRNDWVQGGIRRPCAGTGPRAEHEEC